MRGKRTIYAADLFAGAGGTSTGLMQAAEKRGLAVELLAINHWETAVETHAANHPQANHLCASLERVDPSRVVPRGKLDVLFASPECVHHSNARGGKPMDDQSRASAWHVLHWAERLRVESIVLENVSEFQTWGPLGANGRPLKSRRGETFEAFLAALRSLGYRLEWRVLNAADYGAATTRKRLFLLASRRHRGPRWPRQTHAKRGTAGLFAGDVAPWRAAREVIDWSIPGTSIFNRERPLAENTLRRIEEGLRRFGGAAAEPFLVLLRGTQRGHLASSARDAGEPVPTLTAGGTHVGLVEPFVVKTSHRGGNGAYVRPVDDPLYTVTTAPGGELGLVEPFLVPFYGERPGQPPRSHDLAEPVPTLPCSPKFGLVEPFTVDVRGADRPKAPRSLDDPMATITTRHGTALVEPFLLGQQSGGAARHVDEPAPTVAGRGAISLVEPFVVQYNAGSGGTPVQSVEAPLGTVTTRERFGLVQPRSLDIRFRMLQVHELARASGFPDGYEWKGNKAEIVKQIGNAVEVHQAEALAGAVLDSRA